jgi:hypothetical protein
MKLWKIVTLGALIGALAIVGCCIGLTALIIPETAVKVTIDNRMDRPLTNGSYGQWRRTKYPAEPPLDVIPAHSKVTCELRGIHSETTFIRYLINSARYDSVDLGYQAEEGGVQWTWITAEHDSLFRDSVMFAPRNFPARWSRYGRDGKWIPDTVAKIVAK